MMLTRPPEFRVRPVLLDQDYAMLCAWWEGNGTTPCPLPLLPVNGVVVERSGNPLAALWLYRTDSALAWIETAVVNPEAGERERADALATAFDALTLLAGALGHTRLVAYPDLAGMARQLEHRGWSAHPMTCMRRDL